MVLSSLNSKILNLERLPNQLSHALGQVAKMTAHHSTKHCSTHGVDIAVGRNSSGFKAVDLSFRRQLVPERQWLRCILLPKPLRQLEQKTLGCLQKFFSQTRKRPHHTNSKKRACVIGTQSWSVIENSVTPLVAQKSQDIREKQLALLLLPRSDCVTTTSMLVSFSINHGMHLSRVFRATPAHSIITSY